MKGSHSWRPGWQAAAYTVRLVKDGTPLSVIRRDVFFEWKDIALAPGLQLAQIIANLALNPFQRVDLKEIVVGPKDGKIGESAFWQGKPGAELRSTFNLREAAFQGRDVNARELKKEAFEVASSFFNFPLKNVDSFLDTALRLQRENMHEIVIYIPEYDSYQTADLSGTATLRVGP